MKRKAFVIPLVYLILSAVLITAIAAGGDSSDPLVSLSYLNGTYASTVDAKVTEKLNASDAALLDAASRKLSGSDGSAAGSSYADTWTEKRMKKGDMLSGGTGLNVTVLAGSASVSFSSGAVVDVTDGRTVESGSSLTGSHRYLVAEDAAAVFTVTSETAVVDYMGNYSFTNSDSVDYNAMAAALKTMNLFKGSYTGYGSGYDLEVAPTRLQALIMFIRVLGEEDAALSYTGTAPFSDIAPGTDAAKYVGYAYAKGYTNGYTATLWKPSRTVNAYQYTEFLLRALGYSSSANTDLSGTLEAAQSSGVLTAGEVSILKNCKFLRAELVYLSYYALDATVSGSSDTLREVLIAKGVFTADDSGAARALVTGSRVA
jgi:hypothetical protein